MFTGKTSWDQYRQVFEAIVSSNGWDGVTAALQLVFHFEGDALNVALLVPASRWVPGVLLEAMTEHYSSPGRLADYRRRFERISRRPGEDLSVFAVELETLALRAFGDLSSSARLQLLYLQVSPTERRDLVMTRQFRFVSLMTVVPLLIRIRFCQMRICRLRRARGIGGRLFRFVIFPQRYRLWTSLRMLGLVIRDGQCGVRSIRWIFQVVICSCLLV